MQITDGIYHDTFTLNSYEVDPFYQVQTTYYFRIMQEAAGSHAYQRELSIPHLQQEQKTWVVTRTVMQIDHYATWPDTLRVETWPQEPWKLYFPRVCRLHDSQGNRLFQSLTHWVVMDTTIQRPVKPQSIADRFGPVHAETFVDPNLGRRANVNTAVYARILRYEPTVHYSDCDLSHHVNNVVYVEWILESLSHAFRDSNLVTQVDISYLSQTYRNDRVMVRTGFSEASDELYHEIVRHTPEGEKPVCVATTRWRARD